jgi:hypothetical protein
MLLRYLTKEKVCNWYLNLDITLIKLGIYKIKITQFYLKQNLITRLHAWYKNYAITLIYKIKITQFHDIKKKIIIKTKYNKGLLQRTISQDSNLKFLTSLYSYNVWV